MSLADELAPGKTGLEQLQALMNAGRMPGIGGSLQFTLLEAAHGRVVFGGTPGPHAYNPIGTVHGGYAATLLDSACGCAVHSALSATQGYTTLELKVAYHKAMADKTGVPPASARTSPRAPRYMFLVKPVPEFAQRPIHAHVHELRSLRHEQTKPAVALEVAREFDILDDLAAHGAVPRRGLVRSARDHDVLAVRERAIAPAWIVDRRERSACKDDETQDRRQYGLFAERHHVLSGHDRDGVDVHSRERTQASTPRPADRAGYRRP